MRLPFQVSDVVVPYLENDMSPTAFIQPKSYLHFVPPSVALQTYSEDLSCCLEGSGSTPKRFQYG